MLVLLLRRPKRVGIVALFALFTGVHPSYRQDPDSELSSVVLRSGERQKEVLTQSQSYSERTVAQKNQFDLKILDELLATTDASARKTQGLLLSEMLYGQPQALGMVVSIAYDVSYDVATRRDLARALARQKEGDDQGVYRGIWQQRLMASVLVYRQLFEVEGQRARLAGEMIGVASRLDVSPVTVSVHYATIDKVLDVASCDQVPDARSRKAPSQLMLHALATYLSHLSRQGLDINDRAAEFAQMTGVPPDAYARGEGMDPGIFWVASMQTQPKKGYEAYDLRDLGSIIEKKLNSDRR